MSGERYASDFNEYLIELYKALQNDCELPDSISEKEYKYIKENKDENKPLTAFVGFGCSFAAKWFGGYARDGRKKDRDYAYTAKHGLIKKMQTMKNIKFQCIDYKKLEPHGMLIYCDPPYNNTTCPYGLPVFNTDDFWNTMRKWSADNDVYISEYNAPEDFICALEIQTRTDIRNKENKMDARVEKLFTYKK
jgi:DNA adenine methylase